MDGMPLLLLSFLSLFTVGLIVSVWYRRRSSNRRLPKTTNSIRQYLLSRNLIFAGIVIVISSVVVFVITMLLSTQIQITHMAANSLLASTALTAFQTDLEEELDRFGNEEALIGRDKATTARALGRLYRTTEHFQRVVLVNNEEAIIYAYPPEDPGSTLTDEEQLAVAAVINNGLKQRVISKNSAGEDIVSIIVPVVQENSFPATVLIGRVPSQELSRIIGTLEDGQFSSYIIDSEDRLIARTDGENPSTAWMQAPIDNIQNLKVPGGVGGKVFLYKNQNQSRDLIYITPRTAQSWYVATVMPYGNVFKQAFFYAFSLAATFFIVAFVFYKQLDRYGQNLSMPITELANASRSIAKGGKLTTRVYSNRQDEIGDLVLAFTDMQLALKGRLDELSLLLNISQDISSSINIMQSMPVILQGALRGTGAAGARILILDPSGKVPLSFTEGPAGPDLAPFDRSLMTALRENNELAMASPRQISAQSNVVQAENSPIKSIYALPLRLNARFQGVFFLGFRQARDFDESERALLRTLAGQAAILVDNAYLFANAEGGRRRLAAVLESTTEAVIVTDQSDRILVINRAMEDAFQLSADRVKGRALVDIIESQPLVQALTQAEVGKLDLEIKGRDGRSYIANVSPIISQGGLKMGRVAILTDVTHYKEIDRLKSDFVSNVSHDLLTPLTVMSGFAAALSMSENLSAEQQKYINNISKSVEHMTGMVETLLNMARIEAGVDIFFEEVDIIALLREVVDEHWLYAHEAGIVLRVKESRGLPHVVADKTLLNQAISNFLTNGYKYAPNSGDMILAAEQVGNEVVISVQDHGPGIAGADQIRIFEKFYRIERHGEKKIKGTGLGLGMVKLIADRHGGRAWCQSDQGKGSTFCISVPLKGEDAQKLSA